MEKPCKNCPFRRGNEWDKGVSDKILALQETDRQRVFSCHALHPDANVFTVKDMEHNDCAGFRMMQENMISANTHPEVVNCFNETLPAYDLTDWARHENYISSMNLI